MNAEISHLPVGRRVAFDRTTGRLWVICQRCGQWNLMPIEERWDALEECERLALTAEAHARGASAGLACTQSGLELLRVGGMPDEEIANWRYGRRLRERQRVVLWIAAMLGALAVLLGMLAGRVTDATGVGAWVALFTACWLAVVWRRPPHLLVRLSSLGGRPVRLWAWDLSAVQLGEAEDGAAELCLTIRGGEHRLRGNAAAKLLAELLPKLNGAESAVASIPQAVARVSRCEELATLPSRRRGRKGNGRGHAQQAAVRRPWEHLAPPFSMPVIDLAPETRLALEMAVTEEVERAAMRECANALSAEWHDEEEVGKIADNLLVPPEIEKELREARGQTGEMQTDEERPRKRRADEQ